jgi:hypothetical protein
MLPPKGGTPNGLISKITRDLQNQCAVKLNTGLHQHAGSHHFTKHVTHWRGVPAVLAIGGTAAQNLGPRVGQTHDAASDRQSIE